MQHTRAADVVLFEHERLFAIGQRVYEWSTGMEQRFVSRTGMGVSDFLRLGKLHYCVLWRLGTNHGHDGRTVFNTACHFAPEGRLYVRPLFACTRGLRRAQQRWRERKAATRCVALMMGAHPRLGAGSWLRAMDAELVKKYFFV
jgi:hypothetical protein